MINTPIELYITLILACSTGLLGWMQWRSGSNVQRADAAEKIGNAYDSLLDKLNDRIIDLEDRVQNLEHDLKRYTAYTSLLTSQLVENGIVPLKMETDPKTVQGEKKA